MIYLALGFVAGVITTVVAFICISVSRISGDAKDEEWEDGWFNDNHWR